MTAQKTENSTQDRRHFISDALRTSGVIAVAGTASYLVGRRSQGEAMVWQLDPDKCTGCGNCATYCVLDVSAVKCVNAFDMCGFCDVCTGYFEMDYLALDTAAENQLCPTGAVIREFVEDKSGQRFYEYTIDAPLCIGCGKCVKGCALMNGSLYLQVEHDRCLDCNECAIATACPTEAFYRVPASQAEILKKRAVSAYETRGQRMVRESSEGEPQHQEGLDLLQRTRMQREWRKEQQTIDRVAAAGEGRTIDG